MADEETLRQIERLLVLNLIDGKDTKDAVKLLHRAEYNSSEIGDFIGMSPSTVRTKIGNLREAGEIDA